MNRMLDFTCKQMIKWNEIKTKYRVLEYDETFIIITVTFDIKDCILSKNYKCKAHWHIRIIYIQY